MNIIKLTLEISDPETVSAYWGVHRDLIFQDLRSGTLLDKADLIKCEKIQVSNEVKINWSEVDCPPCNK